MRKVNPLHMANLLANLALVGSVLTVAGEIDLVHLSLFFIAVLWSLLERRPAAAPLLRPMILFILVVLGIAVSLVSSRDQTIFHRALGVLLIMVAAKLVSPKRQRDLLQIFLLNFFIVAASASTMLDLGFALLVTGEAFLTITGLLLVHGSGELPEIPGHQVWKLFRIGGAMTLFLIPAAAFLFLVIPRPSMYFFSWGEGTVSRTGFGDTVSPGSVQEIKADNTIAFRVIWLSGPRPEKPLFRGTVYDAYNQGTWARNKVFDVPVPAARGELAEYEIVAEPSHSRFLFSLGVPLKVFTKEVKTRIVSGYTILSDRNITSRIIYRVHSSLPRGLPPDSSPDLFLEAPDELVEGLATFSRGLTRESDHATARATEDFLRNGFTYDLSPGEPQGDPILHFLTGSRKGHCEYFASAMVFLLRSMGVPARMVGGYAGGEWNEMGKYYLVRQSDAHTWVEAWIRGRGWVTFDPTPSSSSAGRSRSSSWYHVIDVLRLKWYYWVLDYNIARQLELAGKGSELFKSLRHGRMGLDLAGKVVSGWRWLVGAAFLIGLGALAVVFHRRLRERPRTPGERFLHLLKRHGCEKRPGETLLEVIIRVDPTGPELRRSLKTFVDEYYRVEYGGKGGEETLSGLLKEVRAEMAASRKRAHSFSRIRSTTDCACRR